MEEIHKELRGKAQAWINVSGISDNEEVSRHFSEIFGIEEVV